MNAVPVVGVKWDEEMVMPDTEEKEYSITHCKFAPRCPYATDECRAQRPELRDMGSSRKVMCFHPIVQARTAEVG